MFPIASASFKCIASTPFSASSLQPSHSQRLLSTRHSPPVERRRQHIAVVNGASDVNNVTDGGTSDSHRSFIERDANKSARVLQNQKPLRFGFIGCGAMAEAMARGFLDSKVVQSESIACYGGNKQRSSVSVQGRVRHREYRLKRLGSVGRIRYNLLVRQTK
jgi:hypothetical protein